MAGTRNPDGLRQIDPILTNLALAYAPDGFIADQIASNIDVPKNAGQYPTWDLGDFFRDDVEAEIDQRAPTPEIDASYSWNDYLLKSRRLKVSITEEERWEGEAALRLEEQKVKLLRTRFALQREKRLAAKLRKTTNGGLLTLGAAPSNNWNVDAATIETDIKTGRKAVRDATGQLVDTIIMDWAVAYEVALQQDIRDIVKYTVNGSDIIELGDRLLPRTLHGLNVVIAGAGNMKNTAKEGATNSLSSVWGDNVILVKRGTDNAWGEPATVYNLRGQVNGSRPSPSGEPGYVLVDRWTTDDPPIDNIRMWEKVEEKVVAPDVGYEIASVLS